MKNITNRELRQMFRRLNKKYFGDKLDCCVSYGDLSEDDCVGIAYGDCEIILDVTQRKSPSNSEITLLHEMVHAELHRSNPRCVAHGTLFWRRIDELYKAGAYKGLL